jgi:hypothetical protein
LKRSYIASAILEPERRDEIDENARSVAQQGLGKPAYRKERGGRYHAGRSRRSAWSANRLSGKMRRMPPRRREIHETADAFVFDPAKAIPALKNGLGEIPGLHMRKFASSPAIPSVLRRRELMRLYAQLVFSFRNELKIARPTKPVSLSLATTRSFAFAIAAICLAGCVSRAAVVVPSALRRTDLRLTPPHPWIASQMGDYNLAAPGRT